MSDPTTPDPALAQAAAALKQQLLALDSALAAERFEVSSEDRKITAKVSGDGELEPLTIDAALLTKDLGPMLPGRLIPVLKAAIAKANAKARADLASLAAGFSLPGLPARRPPVLPDIPGFGEAVTSFQHQMRALEEAAVATSSYVGRAADDKVAVTVNGLLEVTAITLKPSLFSSADAHLAPGFIQDAFNRAVRAARHEEACKVTGTAAATVVRGAVIVYVGYLDNAHGTRNPAETPTPFDPDMNRHSVATLSDSGVIRFDANIILISSGGVATPHDTGVLRFENLTNGPVTIDPGLLKVTTQQATFQIWDGIPPITLAPRQNLILAETKKDNFDTSDTGLKRNPVVRGRVKGRAFKFTDTARVLLGREDAGEKKRNETTPYQVLGRIVVPVMDKGAVILYVGYLDNAHAKRNPAQTPTPFDAAANTILISTGGVATPHDTGVLRFENRTEAPVTIEPGLQVTTEQKVFQLWDDGLPITLAPGHNLVLAETAHNNFDTSDTGLGRDPEVSGKVNGIGFSFNDTARKDPPYPGRVLLGREDAGKKNRNETTPYHVLGRIEVEGPL